MKSTLTVAGLALTLSLASASDARAQMQWTNKGFVNFTLGAQAPSQDLATATAFDLYDETATLSTTQDVGGGFFFDISGGYKAWRNLVVGVGFSRVASETDLTINAEIPDPVFFDRPRSVSTTASGAQHSQPAIHLFGMWMMPVTDKVDVGFQFGPSIFMVSQDLPTGISVSEPGPTITSVNISSVDNTTVGIHFGVDVTYLVTPRLGAGVIARYAWGSVDLEGTDESLTVGGFQIGGGVRVRF
jgi:opacity protein-like surface antigen